MQWTFCLRMSLCAPICYSIMFRFFKGTICCSQLWYTYVLTSLCLCIAFSDDSAPSFSPITSTWYIVYLSLIYTHTSLFAQHNWKPEKCKYRSNQHSSGIMSDNSHTWLPPSQYLLYSSNPVLVASKLCDRQTPCIFQEFAVFLPSRSLRNQALGPAAACFFPERSSESLRLDFAAVVFFTYLTIQYILLFFSSLRIGYLF